MTLASLRETGPGILVLALILLPLMHSGTALLAQEVITVELGEFYFEPSTVTIPAGTTVRLILTNVGSIPHTFTVSELNIDVTLNPGETVEIEVTVEEAGEFELVCRFHIAQGMVGTFVVAQQQPVETVTVTETVTETVTTTETVTVAEGEVTVTETIVTTETVRETETTTVETTTTVERVVTETVTTTTTETTTQTVEVEAGRLGTSIAFLIVGLIVGSLAAFLLRRR